MDMAIHEREMIDQDHAIGIITMITIDRITDRRDQDTIVDTVIHKIERHLMVFTVVCSRLLNLRSYLEENPEAPKERPRLQLQPRTKPLEEFQPLSGSSLSVNSAVVNSSPSNLDESHENSSNHPDEYQRQESHETSGAGASIFGGARPVNTAAKELEIERKLQELQMANSETTDDQTERPPSSRPNYNRQNDRNNYRQNDRNQRPSHNQDYYNRDRRDDGTIDNVLLFLSLFIVSII